MKTYLHTITIMTLCLLTPLLLTSCGDDDENDSSSNNNSSYEAPDYKAMLTGQWTGKGTNWDDASLSVQATFESATSGHLLLSHSKTSSYYASMSIVNFSDWSASDSYIVMSTDKYATPVRFRIQSGSIASGKISIEIECENNHFSGLAELTKTDGGGGGSSSGSSSSSSETELGSTTAFIIKMVQSSSGKANYSSSTATCYKKRNLSGGIDLYRYSNYTSKIGTASSNNLSKWGDYRVSSYDYLVRYSVTTSSSTYYFFN